MDTHILNQMREKVRRRQYVMTWHADEEMDDDGLTIFDVESGILTGTIIERQKTARPRNENIWFGVKRLMTQKPLSL